MLYPLGHLHASCTQILFSNFFIPKPIATIRAGVTIPNLYCLFTHHTKGGKKQNIDGPEPGVENLVQAEDAAEEEKVEGVCRGGGGSI